MLSILASHILQESSNEPYGIKGDLNFVQVKEKHGTWLGI